MINKIYPREIDPWKLADKGAKITGSIPLAGMRRLNEIQAPQKNEVNFILEFCIDPQGVVYLQGHIDAKAILQCQRCLELYEQHISAEFLLSPVTNDKEAAKLPAPYEALLVENNMVELAVVIEDEILLNLPIIAKHVPEDCSVAEVYSNGPEGCEFVEEKANPFKILANLKTNKQ